VAKLPKPTEEPPRTVGESDGKHYQFCRNCLHFNSDGQGGCGRFASEGLRPNPNGGEMCCFKPSEWTAKPRPQGGRGPLDPAPYVVRVVQPDGRVLDD
jgi:hypothetical protein